MTDRDKMIDLAVKWYGLEDWPCESDRVIGLLDRLIEAGFGRVEKKSEKCPACGNEYRDNSGSCPHGCHSNFSWIKEYGL